MARLTVGSSAELRTLLPSLPREDHLVHYRANRIKTREIESFITELQIVFEEQIYAFHSTCPSPVIFDCGGHIGSALIYFKQKYPQAQVTVFEANPIALEYLHENIRLNRLEHVDVVEHPLFSARVPVEFVVDIADGGCIEGLGCVSGEKITVEAVLLSDYLKDRHVDMLKMNIEGAECAVLKEAAAYLKNVDRLVLEYHGFSKTEQHLHQILTVLDDQGFQYVINSFPRNINGNAWPPFRISDFWFSLVYAEKRGLIP